jgi:hypothetical protein
VTPGAINTDCSQDSDCDDENCDELKCSPAEVECNNDDMCSEETETCVSESCTETCVSTSLTFVGEPDNCKCDSSCV